MNCVCHALRNPKGSSSLLYCKVGLLIFYVHFIVGPGDLKSGPDKSKGVTLLMGNILQDQVQKSAGEP